MLLSAFAEAERPHGVRVCLCVRTRVRACMCVCPFAVHPPSGQMNKYSLNVINSCICSWFCSLNVIPTELHIKIIHLTSHDDNKMSNTNTTSRNNNNYNHNDQFNMFV